MKIKFSLSLFTLLIVSTLAFCVFAQIPVSGDGGTGTVVIKDTPATLCVTFYGVRIDRTLPNSGTLLIEMLDGSVQQIELKTVKAMKVRDTYNQ